jgi:hypothetical protein
MAELDRGSQQARLVNSSSDKPLVDDSSLSP